MSMQRAWRARPGTAVCIVTWAGVSRAALACPICDSGTGQRVRAGLFDDAFWFNLGSAAAPFVVFGVIAALIHFRWRDE